MLRSKIKLDLYFNILNNNYNKKGYLNSEKSKNAKKVYINLNLNLNIMNTYEITYWKFILDNKVNNIIIIEDKNNEAIVSKFIIYLNVFISF